MRRVLIFFIVICIAATGFLSGCRPRRSPSSSFSKPAKTDIAEEKREEAERLFEGFRAEQIESKQPLHMPLIYDVEDVLQVAELTSNPAEAHRLAGAQFINEIQYSKAIAEFQQALRLAQRNEKAETDLKKARRLDSLLKMLLPQLPKAQKVLCLAEITRSGNSGAFVVTASEMKDSIHDFISPVARYFIIRGRNCKLVYQTTKIVSPDDEFNVVNSAMIWIADIQHTGKPQIILGSVINGADHIRGVADIFEMRHGSPTHIFHGDGAAFGGGDFPVEFVDLNHDSRPEVRVINIQGGWIEELPNWEDIYRYNGRRYVRANGKFPKLANEQLQEFLKASKEHPDDWNLLDCLATAYRDVGNYREAALYEKRAKKAEHGK